MKCWKLVLKKLILKVIKVTLYEMFYHYLKLLKLPCRSGCTHLHLPQLWLWKKEPFLSTTETWLAASFSVPPKEFVPTLPWNSLGDPPPVTHNGRFTKRERMKKTGQIGLRSHDKEIAVKNKSNSLRSQVRRTFTYSDHKIFRSELFSFLSYNTCIY